jgi:hypothetical protein
MQIGNNVIVPDHAFAQRNQQITSAPVSVPFIVTIEHRQHQLILHVPFPLTPSRSSSAEMNDAMTAAEGRRPRLRCGFASLENLLSGYIGETVQISMQGAKDFELQTSLVVDDVTLTVSP